MAVAWLLILGLQEAPKEEPRPQAPAWNSGYDGGFFIAGENARFIWYANEFVKIKLNYLKTIYAESIVVDGDPHDDEDAVLLQFQVMF